MTMQPPNAEAGDYMDQPHRLPQADTTAKREYMGKPAMDPHQLTIVDHVQTGAVTLEDIIGLLPTHITQDDIHPTPVMRHWTTELPLRYQGVIVSALRGCDGAPKNDPSKGLTRMIRRAVMNPADARETIYARGFFGFNADDLQVSLREFLKSTDQYPHHYLMHLMHASEVIGYCHPNTVMGAFFQLIYAELCFGMHLMPENKAQMQRRLTMDRIAAGTVES